MNFKNITSRSSNKFMCAAVAVALSVFASGASAVAVSTIVDDSNAANVMTNALLAPTSGISVVAGSATIQGRNTLGAEQFGTYSNFNLTSTDAANPTLTMANGVVLTTGAAVVAATNTSASYSVESGSGANAQLGGLIGSTTSDANTLGFNFTVAEGVKSISAQFVFGTEEFPDQSVTDIFGFFVDGVNYAKFANGELISNTIGSTNFISNLSGNYGIEYDGLTNILTVTGLLDSLLTTHTLMFGVADTSDSIYDSAIYMHSLVAGKGETGGISVVPEPSTTFLFGIALGAAVLLRRKNAAK
jgi:hypothetical protein